MFAFEQINSRLGADSPVGQTLHGSLWLWRDPDRKCHNQALCSSKDEDDGVIGLLQRVSESRVVVDGETVGEIGTGLMVLLGVEKGDREKGAERLIQRILGYRVFPDEQGRMNRSLKDSKGGLLLVPQFTLAADTHKGTRPSFSPAAPPEEGERLFKHALDFARSQHPTVAAGRFGADMTVSLSNEGPVTFWLSVPPTP